MKLPLWLHKPMDFATIAAAGYCAGSGIGYVAGGEWLLAFIQFGAAVSLGILFTVPWKGAK